MDIGISNNGPLTLFELHASNGRTWHLCREDLRKLADGDFEFDDCRPTIDLDHSEKDQIKQQAVGLLQRISEELFLCDFVGHDDHFRANEGKYGRLTVSDLGRKFIFKDRPYVFLGARQRARKYKLAALNLANGTYSGFCVSPVEMLLHGDREVVAAQTDSGCSGEDE
jgi:hypothetical protein